MSQPTAVTLSQLISQWDTLYPPAQAEQWDAPGLHVGDPNQSVTGVLVTLDVTLEVIQEAIDLGCNVIFAHHPLFFKPLTRLTPTTAPGVLALAAARAGIAIFGAHTNLDVSDQSTSTATFDALGITSERRVPLIPLPDERCYKVAVTIPNDEATINRVRDAMHEAGAGADLLGPYEECAFVYPGIGSFTPLPEANPAIGEVGVREYVHEHRIEMMVRHSRKDALLRAIYRSHPYESPAIDLWDLNHGAIPAERGMGWMGVLPKPMAPRDILGTLCEALGNETMRLASQAPDTPISGVAVVGGSASSLIPTVLTTRLPGELCAKTGYRSGAIQLFITADIGHHPASDALVMGLQLIDAGHYATENPAMDAALATLQAACADYPVPWHRSQVCTDPWQATTSAPPARSGRLSAP